MIERREARGHHPTSGSADTWSARCPAHAYAQPLLTIRAGRAGSSQPVILKFGAGCDTDASFAEPILANVTGAATTIKRSLEQMVENGTVVRSTRAKQGGGYEYQVAEPTSNPDSSETGVSTQSAA